MGNGQDGSYDESTAQQLSESAPEVSGVRDDAMYCPHCLENYENIRERVEASDGLDYDREAFDPRAKTFVIPDVNADGVKAFLNGGEFEGRIEIRCPDHEETFMTYEGTITRYDDVFLPGPVQNLYDPEE